MFDSWMINEHHANVASSKARDKYILAYWVFSVKDDVDDEVIVDLRAITCPLNNGLFSL